MKGENSLLCNTEYLIKCSLDFSNKIIKKIIFHCLFILFSRPDYFKYVIYLKVTYVSTSVDCTTYVSFSSEKDTYVLQSKSRDDYLSTHNNLIIF